MSDLSPKHQAFYTHLDNCRQCADHPFELCVTGDVLLRAAGDEVAEQGLHIGRPILQAGSKNVDTRFEQ